MSGVNKRVIFSEAGLSEAARKSVLTNEAIDFLIALHDHFESKRKERLDARTERAREIAEKLTENLKRGDLLPLDFLPETEEVRRGDWKVALAPHDLQDRRVEITGPAEAKMLINALNSGAKVFMADLEDSLSPTWKNVTEGQVALQAAVRRTLTFQNPNGKSYTLNPKIATLVVRPRGWHLPEAHFKIDGQAMSASLFDFGLYFFHNAKALLERKSGPYFYLPKMESHLEARLWNEVFNFAENSIGISQGTIRATVLIETIPAAFEMDEILFELKEHASGLNAGRWDYIFSLIKKLGTSKNYILPDRAQVTMAVPFMSAYAESLVKTCHRRGAHAMGGMSAFIPNRKDETVTENALKKVREDKRREVTLGFDGTWVAHPDLVAVAQAEFDEVLGAKPNQKDKLRAEINLNAEALLDTRIVGGKVTLAGVRANVEVALQYLERWLQGVGAAAIHNLMEDAATAEIARAQLWQWIRHKVTLEGEGDSLRMDRTIYETVRKEELEKLINTGIKDHRFLDASKILDDLVLAEKFSDFLTLNAYPFIKKD